MNTDKMNRVMYIWSTPAVGHLNPTLCFTNQLLTRLETMKIKKIIFYSGMPFRDLILNLPNNQGKDLIEFRDYELKKYWGHDDLLKNTYGLGYASRKNISRISSFRKFNESR